MKTATQVLEDLYETSWALRREHLECPNLNSDILKFLIKLASQIQKLEKELETV